MIFPAIYAVLVWALAMRWRRRWEGLTAVAAGVALLLLVDFTIRRIDHALPEVGIGAASVAAGPKRSTTFLLQELLRPYIGMVGLVGLYVVSLPRRAPSDAHCGRCHYDLSGLDPRHLACPECGEPFRYECVVCSHPFGDRAPAGLVCPDCGAAFRGPGTCSPPMTAGAGSSPSRPATGVGAPAS